MALSAARGQTAIPLASRRGGKPFRDIQYRERTPSVITNFLMLMAQAVSVSASLKRVTARNRRPGGDKHAGDGAVLQPSLVENKVRRRIKCACARLALSRWISLCLLSRGR
jgi:hypothetical protein